MKILIVDGVSEKGIAILRDKHEVEVRKKITPEELLSIIGEYDALVVRSETKVTSAVLEVARNLKVIGRAGVGVDNIDVPEATRKGIIVLNAPEGNTIAATEHTIGMMLALARNIPRAHGSIQEGKWERSQLTGVELRGKTLGVCGLGRIGSGVAKRALAMEMQVMGYDPFIHADHATALGIQSATLEDIFQQADFITFHLPLTAETRGLVNAERLAGMKDGVRLINCARGGIIDEQDLAEAVKSGKVAGAALDVFAKEPIGTDNPLVGLPQVVLTPHLGASTVEAQVGVAVDVADGVLSALAGEPVMTAVNMAPLPQHVLQVIRPYFTLAERMGCLAIHLADAPVQSVSVEYSGSLAEVDTKMLTTAVVKGLLTPILQETVNYVNASGLAQSRGIQIQAVKSRAMDSSFANLITVRVKTDKGENRVAGTLFGHEESRIVSIDDYRVDVAPKGWLLIGPHYDRPGIIGKVGTILGENNLNIAGMQVGKTDTVGTNIMVLAMDSDVSTPVLEKIKGVEGILGARMVNFNG